jgi:hypothetical protein
VVHEHLHAVVIGKGGIELGRLDVVVTGIDVIVVMPDVGTMAVGGD